MSREPIEPLAVVGKEVGRLLIHALYERESGERKERLRFVAECSCGSVIDIRALNVISGYTSMCSNCLKRFVKAYGVRPERERATPNDFHAIEEGAA